MHRGDHGEGPAEATGDLPDGHGQLEEPSVTLAGADYDPAAWFRGRAGDHGSVTAASSATDVELEWITAPQRYGHFSGRPLDPTEIAREEHRRLRRRWTGRALIAFVLAATAGLFVWELNNDPWVPLAMAEPGTCFLDSRSSLIVRDQVRYEVRTTLEAVRCGSPHEFEVVGTAPMSGFGSTLDMAATAQRLCADVFADYVGAAPGEAGPWRLATFPPYLMFLAGERAHCLAYQGTAEGGTDNPYDPVLVEGSARAAAGGE